MNIIDIDNHNKLPGGAMQCYILVSPEEAAAEFERRFGAQPSAAYRVTVKGRQSLWLEHGEDGHGNTGSGSSGSCL